MSKMGYCQICIYNDHETTRCACQQFRWAMEDLLLNLPFMSKILKGSNCEHFEPLEGWYD